MQELLFGVRDCAFESFSFLVEENEVFTAARNVKIIREFQLKIKSSEFSVLNYIL